jgi:hypothetical protein
MSPFCDTWFGLQTIKAACWTLDAPLPLLTAPPAAVAAIAITAMVATVAAVADPAPAAVATAKAVANIIVVGNTW